jgi:phage host-nuclease inhibitor protein Gam
MAARVKKKTFANVSLEQAQDASSQFATTKNELARIEAKMNEEINKIRSKYAEKVNELTDALEEPQTILEVYAKEQQDSWGKKKSFELLHTTIGFRTGMPKLKLEKSYNWSVVTDLLKEHYPGYVRTVDEPNKEKIIADRESDGFDKFCKKCHVNVVQDETFYIEPKVQEVQPA